MKHVLFVCTENANRSQMAEAFARRYGGDQVVAASAGSKPSGKVNPRAIAAMKAIELDLEGPDLARVSALPWEALAPPEADFVLFRRSFSLVRTPSLPSTVVRRRLPDPIRVLAVMAQPDDPSLHKLDLEKAEPFQLA